MGSSPMTTRLILILLLCASAAVGQAAQKDPNRDARRRIFREKFLDHFNLGVETTGEWIAETREKNGCRWDFKAQYLSGGAALPEKPFWLLNGNTPRSFVDNARKCGTTAWLTFYALAASAPARYKPGPAEATVTNAKVATTMKAYFELFKTFVEGAGKEAPYPVMLQIEPDEWCHLLLSANMDPAKVDVKVGSCGMEELKGLPDNMFGWASAFKRLRDLYAPVNVMLGCNPSSFDANGTMTGQKMGAMMKALAGDWDFAVHETGDHNKGRDKPPPYGTEIHRNGNLEGHLKWTAEFHAASGLYVFIWQVAVGNTHFATCNNTIGHYADNLAQMLLEDYPKNPTISRYIKAGCIGWVFLGGQDDDTRVYDFRKDGITNPPAIPGNLGNKSEYPDDDGGYLRLRGAAYYKKPTPIVAKTAGAKTPPAEAPTAAPAKATVTGPPPPAAIAAWDAKLRAAVAEDLKGGRKIRFQLKVVGQPAEAAAIDDEGVLSLRSDVGNFPCRWVDLTIQDRRNLSVARIRDTKPAADLCLAAFYHFACGDETAAQALLKGVPPSDADEVIASFKAP